MSSEASNTFGEGFMSILNLNLQSQGLFKNAEESGQECYRLCQGLSGALWASDSSSVAKRPSRSVSPVPERPRVPLESWQSKQLLHRSTLGWLLQGSFSFGRQSVKSSLTPNVSSLPIRSSFCWMKNMLFSTSANCYQLPQPADGLATELRNLAAGAAQTEHFRRVSRSAAPDLCQPKLLRTVPLQQTADVHKLPQQTSSSKRI